MELFHNQVTREQGISSYRFNHSSFGLNMLAENTRRPACIEEMADALRKPAEAC